MGLAAPRGCSAWRQQCAIRLEATCARVEKPPIAGPFGGWLRSPGLMRGMHAAVGHHPEWLSPLPSLNLCYDMPVASFIGGMHVRAVCAVMRCCMGVLVAVAQERLFRQKERAGPEHAMNCGRFDHHRKAHAYLMWWDLALKLICVGGA